MSVCVRVHVHVCVCVGWESVGPMDSWDDAELSLEVLRLQRMAAGRKAHQQNTTCQPSQPSHGSMQVPKLNRKRRHTADQAAAPRATQASLRRPGVRKGSKASGAPRWLPPRQALWRPCGRPCAFPRRCPTVCSGLESVMAAFDQMGLGDRAQLQFICEKDTAACNLIQSHRSLAFIYDDISTWPSNRCLSVTSMLQVLGASLGQPQGFARARLTDAVVGSSSRTSTSISASNLPSASSWRMSRA